MVAVKETNSAYSYDRLALGGIMFFCAYVSLYFISWIAKSDLPIATIAVYFAFLAFLFSRRFFFFKYVWIIFTASWIVVADALLVGGHIWLNELQTTTYSNGSLLPIAVAFSAMLYFALLLESRKISLNRDKPDCLSTESNYTKTQMTIIKWAGVIALLVAIVCFAFVAAHPSWLYARDRFDYAAKYLPSFLSSNQQYLILLIPLALPCWKTGKKGIFYAVIVVYVLYLIWTGEKFTSLFLLFYVLLLAIAVPRLSEVSPRLAVRMSNRTIGFSFCVMFACLGLVLIQYSLQFGSGEAVSMLQQRVASQGEVWWGVYGYSSAVGPKPFEVGDELATFYTVGDSSAVLYDSGMWKLMQLIMTPNYYAMYVENATRLSSSTPASLYYYFGYFGLVVGLLILVGIYYLIINKTIDSFKKIRIVESILYVYLIRVMHGVLIMSDFNTLFSWRTLIVVCLLFFIDVIRGGGAREKTYRDAVYFRGNSRIKSVDSFRYEEKSNRRDVIKDDNGGRGCCGGKIEKKAF